MDWVHCNICFHQPGQRPKREFYLTNCGHIFCKNCERTGNIVCCKVCGACCTSTPLTSNMSPEVEEYFNDSETFAEKTLKVIQFQNSHRLKLIEHYRKGMDKYQNLKIAYLKLQDSLKKVQEENKNLRKETEFYRRRIVQSTPSFPEPSSPSFFNLSNQRTARQHPEDQQKTPFFATPPLPKPVSRQYRNELPSPLTPGSDDSASPGSVGSSSNLSYRSVSSNNGHKPGSTPPYNQLSKLSVRPGSTQHI